GSGATTFGTWTYTNGEVAGTRVFYGVAPGSYVARAYENDAFGILAESAEFTVANPEPADASTDAADGATRDGALDSAPDTAADGSDESGPTEVAPGPPAVVCTRRIHGPGRQLVSTVASAADGRIAVSGSLSNSTTIDFGAGPVAFGTGDGGFIA